MTVIPNELVKAVLSAAETLLKEGKGIWTLCSLKRIQGHRDDLVSLYLRFLEKGNVQVRDHIYRLVGDIYLDFPWKENRRRFWRRYLAGGTREREDLGWLFGRYKDLKFFRKMEEIHLASENSEDLLALVNFLWHQKVEGALPILLEAESQCRHSRYGAPMEGEGKAIWEAMDKFSNEEILGLKHQADKEKERILHFLRRKNSK